jgi:uncharacterized membrane protein (Fun14 family)
VSEAPPPAARSTVSRRIAEQLHSVPAWHKKLIVAAIVLCGVGLAGQGFARFSQQHEGQQSSAPADSRSAVESSGARVPQDAPLWQRVSPHATKIGISLVIGFIVGFLFRAFLKTMALIVLVIGGIILALSYFDILNIDFASAREQTEQAASWLTQKVTAAREMVMAHLPSGVASAVGAFLGFRRS